MAARRGGSKALCQMEDEYIGNILYKISRPALPRAIAYVRSEMSEKFVNKASEHVHAARRATN